MNPSESDPQNELLRSIAASLKGIQSSLDQLTGAVEGVAESIEKAHEPEGDLGHHLVGALKDLSSALHKRAQQERAPQPQQRQPLPNQRQTRYEERPHQRPDHHSHQEFRANPAPELHPDLQQNTGEVEAEEDQQQPEPPSGVQNSPTDGREPRPRKPRPRRRRGGSAGGPAQAPAASPSESGN